MKRIAAPMVGGVMTSGVMELLVFPVIYFMWRGLKLNKDMQPSAEAEPVEGGTYISRPSREEVDTNYE